MPAPDAAPTVVFALVGDVRQSSRALRQLRALAALGCRIEALTFGEETDEARAVVSGEAVAEGVRLHVLPRPSGRGPVFFWRAHRLFRRVASTLAADVYHASDLYTLPALAAAAERHGGRLVFDARELYPHVDATAGKPWATWTWAALERCYVPRCDAVLTVNASIAERMAAAYGIAPPVVLPNVSDPQRAAPSEALRERLAIPPGQPIVLYQGLIRAGRGLERVVDAMRDVPAALVVVGDGPAKAALQEQARDRLGRRVHFLPHTPPDDLLTLTASADVGVCLLEPISLSVYLALPNKLFEYLAAGLPVVVSDLPEMRRVVEGFGVGLAVPYDDRAALVAALSRALTDEAARQRWRSHIPEVFEAFSPERTRRRFQEVYARLLPVPSPG